MKGIEWNSCPEFFGYNRCGKAKEGGILLGKIEGNPFIVVGEYGEVSKFQRREWRPNYLQKVVRVE